MGQAEKLSAPSRNTAILTTKYHHPNNHHQQQQQSQPSLTFSVHHRYVFFFWEGGMQEYILSSNFTADRQRKPGVSEAGLVTGFTRGLIGHRVQE